MEMVASWADSLPVADRSIAEAPHLWFFRTNGRGARDQFPRDPWPARRWRSRTPAVLAPLSEAPGKQPNEKGSLSGKSQNQREVSRRHFAVRAHFINQVIPRAGLA